MTEAPPLLLVVGPAGHGVVDYGADVAAEAGRLDARLRVAVETDVAAAMHRAARADRVHLHVTDRILGGSPEEAASVVEQLAARTRLTVTLHDVPQDSDGRMRDRRVGAYRRMAGAAAGVVVNSAHERMLVAEHLGAEFAPFVIPLGARVGWAPGSDPHPAAPDRDLTVLIAGYVYPGKGHDAAIDAAGVAATLLRDRGESVGTPVVRAIGRPSHGHESDIAAFEARASRAGVRWELTGFLDDDAFAEALCAEGVPLAAHEHVSASRSMLEWGEAGRRVLVLDSRYARETAELRPGTVDVYDRHDLAGRLARAWRHPERTRLEAGTSLAPALADVAGDYLAWWRAEAAR